GDAPPGPASPFAAWFVGKRGWRAGKDLDNLRQDISSLSRSLRQRVEPADNFLGALAEDDVFSGRTRLEFLDPGLSGMQVLNDFNPFETYDASLLQNVEGGVHGAPLCNRSDKQSRARLDPLAESSKPPIRSFAYRLSEIPCEPLEHAALKSSCLA